MCVYVCVCVCVCVSCGESNCNAAGFASANGLSPEELRSSTVGLDAARKEMRVGAVGKSAVGRSSPSMCEAFRRTGQGGATAAFQDQKRSGVDREHSSLLQRYNERKRGWATSCCTLVPVGWYSLTNSGNLYHLTNVEYYNTYSLDQKGYGRVQCLARNSLAQCHGFCPLVGSSSRVCTKMPK